MSAFVISAFTVAATMFAVWLASLRLRDASIVDMFWGFTYPFVAIACWVVADRVIGPNWASMAIGVLVIAWGFRLGIHLLTRWRREGQEDQRYQKMRRYHGDAFWWRSLFTVFVFQGLLVWLISMPVQVSFYTGGLVASEAGAIIGLLIAAFGLYMEASADTQLTKFRANAKPGDLLTDGWWTRTRHPNYFGDAMFWWGIWIAVVATTPGAIWTIYAPIMMNFLLVKVSGAEMLERYLLKKPGYAEYMERTNRFIPRLF